jgi:hypothetical protein
MALCITGVIPQRIQLQEKVILASLGWCHKWAECTKSCALRSVLRCQYLSAYIQAEIMVSEVSEIQVEGFQAKWWGHFRRNLRIGRNKRFLTRQWLLNSEHGVTPYKTCWFVISTTVRTSLLVSVVALCVVTPCSFEANHSPGYTLSYVQKAQYKFYRR